MLLTTVVSPALTNTAKGSAESIMPKPEIATFFDPATATASHVVYDHPGGHAAIIDPVLDYDAKSGRTARHSAQQLLDFLQAQRLTLQWILETHAHADHLTAAPYLKARLGGQTGIGEAIRTVQGVFQKVFNLEEGFRTDGSQFDHLFKDGERFKIGTLDAEVIYTPIRNFQAVINASFLPTAKLIEDSRPVYAKPGSTGYAALSATQKRDADILWNARRRPAFAWREQGRAK